MIRIDNICGRIRGRHQRIIESEEHIAAIGLQNHLLRQLTASQQTFTTEREAKNALRETLEAQAVLVILDDVWTVDHADAFLCDRTTSSPVHHHAKRRGGG